MMAHWLIALKPEAGADGLAMHLAIPFDIAANHRLTFDPARFVWAVMPMGADWCYAIVYLLGGEYAAHLLLWSVLLILAALLYGILRRLVSPAVALLLVALFATTPLVQLVTGSLFVENLLAAIILGMVAGLCRFSETGERKFLYLAMALGGTALAIKIAALAFFLPALIFAIVEIVRHRKAPGPRPWVVCAAASALALATAVPTVCHCLCQDRQSALSLFQSEVSLAAARPYCRDRGLPIPPAASLDDSVRHDLPHVELLRRARWISAAFTTW